MYFVNYWLVEVYHYLQWSNGHNPRWIHYVNYIFQCQQNIAIDILSIKVTGRPDLDRVYISKDLSSNASLNATVDWCDANKCIDFHWTPKIFGRRLPLKISYGFKNLIIYVKIIFFINHRVGSFIIGVDCAHMYVIQLQDTVKILKILTLKGLNHKNTHISYFSWLFYLLSGQV